MRRVGLDRLNSDDQGTFGRVVQPDFSLFTAELPDRGNAPDVSCIPPGLYVCRYTLSPRLKEWTYEVLAVPGHVGIRIHSLNFVGDRAKGCLCQAKGCIGLGLRLGRMEGQKAVLLSRPAIRTFEAKLERKPFELEVRQCPSSDS